MPGTEVALKPQNAVECLWPVTKCVFKAPAQGALAKTEFSHKPGHHILLWRRPLGEQPVRHRHLCVRQGLRCCPLAQHAFKSINQRIWAERRRQHVGLAAGSSPNILQPHPLAAKLRRCGAQPRRGASGLESKANHDRSGRKLLGHWLAVRPGHAPPSGNPLQVNGAVRNNYERSSTGLRQPVYPDAREVVPQRVADTMFAIRSRLPSKHRSSVLSAGRKLSPIGHQLAVLIKTSPGAPNKNIGCSADQRLGNPERTFRGGG
ncbi:MAG: hypothetical protein JWL65_2880 [Gammaproteobacteria bacterium]|nr:hypothetical protein [Gammaproteobacteria bacterium]